MIPTASQVTGPGSSFNEITAFYNHSVDTENRIRSENDPLKTIKEHNREKFGDHQRLLIERACDLITSQGFYHQGGIDTMMREHKAAKKAIHRYRMETLHEDGQRGIKRWPNRSGFDQDEKDHERYLTSTIAKYGRMAIDSDLILPTFRPQMKTIYNAYTDYMYASTRSERPPIVVLRRFDHEVEKARRECAQVKEMEKVIFESFMAKPSRESCVLRMYGPYLRWSMCEEERREEELATLAVRMRYESVGQMDEELGDRFVIVVNAAGFQVEEVTKVVVEWFLKGPGKESKCRAIWEKVKAALRRLRK